MYLVPQPQHLAEQPGAWPMTSRTPVVLHASCPPDWMPAAQSLVEEVAQRTGFTLPMNRSLEQETDCILLTWADLPEEAYALSICPKGALLQAGSFRGMLYAVSTLRQILRNTGCNLPFVTIEDRPAFPNRGYYWDITRGRVPTLEAMKEMVDRMALLKLNQLQLYVEHTFAFRNMSEVWTGADPLSAAEILELDAYCRAHGVELVPSLSTFGHLYHALSSRSFGDLCELPDSVGQPFSWLDRMMHHTLDVSNPRSIDLIKAMLDEYLPLFSSEQCNICCDETFDLGRGRNRARAEQEGKGNLYVDFVLQVVDHVRGRGKRVMLWSDILLQHPETLSRLPEDVVLLHWYYDAQPVEEHARLHGQSGKDFYMCCGTNGWNRFVNDYDTAYLNISRMAALGRQYGASGLLNTDWGDLGHFNHPSLSHLPIAWGASFGWNPEGYDSQAALTAAASRLLYGDDGQTGDMLWELSRCQRVSLAPLVVRYEQPRELHPHHAKLEAEAFGADPAGYEADAHSADCLAQDLFARTFQGAHRWDARDAREWSNAAEGIALLNRTMLAFQAAEGRADAHPDLPPAQLAAAWEVWLREFEGCWLARNRPSELYRAVDFVRWLAGRLRAMAD
jgi:hypothetical protein